MISFMQRSLFLLANRNISKAVIHQKYDRTLFPHGCLRMNFGFLADKRGRTRNPDLTDPQVEIQHYTNSLTVPNLLKTWKCDINVSMSENVILKRLMRGGKIQVARRILRGTYAYLKRTTGADPSILLHEALSRVSPLVTVSKRVPKRSRKDKKKIKPLNRITLISPKPLGTWTRLRLGADALMKAVPLTSNKGKAPKIHIRLAHEIINILKGQSKSLDTKIEHHRNALYYASSIIRPEANADLLNSQNRLTTSRIYRYPKTLTVDSRTEGRIIKQELKDSKKEAVLSRDNI